MPGGAGIKTAALVFGGGPPPAPTAKQIQNYGMELAWTEVNNLNTARAFVAGAGTYTHLP